MKRVLSVLVLFVSLICLNGCGCNNKIDFSYFKNKINNIEGYRYYIVSQEIYNGELLLYKKDKNVYYDNEKVRIQIETKEIESIESDDLYKESEEEFYQNGNDFYYKEDGVWKIEEREIEEGLGFSIEKDMFDSYKIEETNNYKVFTGKLEETSLFEFFGFEISDVKDIMLMIEIGGSDKVRNVSLTYFASNGNKVVVEVKVGYTQVIKFNLPAVE